MLFYRFPGGKGSNVSLLSMDCIISDTNYTCSTTSGTTSSKLLVVYMQVNGREV